jgi:hypothetical protein
MVRPTILCTGTDERLEAVLDGEVGRAVPLAQGEDARLERIEGVPKILD